MTVHAVGATVPTARFVLAAYFGLSVLCLLAFSLDLAPMVDAVCFAVMAVATCTATVIGPRLHHAPDRLTWWGLTLVALLFVMGPVLRPITQDGSGALLLLPDMFVLPGYVIALCMFLRLLRRRGNGEREALLDTGIVLIGSMLFTAAFLITPALGAGRTMVVSLVLAAYPVLDVGMLSLLVVFAFTVRERAPALLLLGLTVCGLLVGDVAYNWLARTGRMVGPHVLDLPFLAGFAFLGLAALHPSMVQLSAGTSRRIQPWSWRRLALIVPFLLVPGVLAVVEQDAPRALRVVEGLGSAALVVILLVRATRAVKEQTASREVYEHLATHDALTGLANRTSLTEQLDALLVHQQSVNVLFLDLDGFKMVNDSWGHRVGDELLQLVADRLRRHIPPDVLVARTGGDEFVLVTHTRRQDSEGLALAEHVLTELSEPYQLSVGEVVITPSVGVTSTQTCDELTAAALIRDADTAMYRAKDAGRSRTVVFEVSMRDRVRQRVELDRALRQAMPRDELDVVFQPIVDLVSRRAVGFEALCRWRRPDAGPCSPADFIPLAEENGLIVPLGRFVLGRALDELLRWRAASPAELMVSVNVSGRQLLHGGFAQDVESALAERGLRAHDLRLEITESTLVGDDPVAGAALRRLADAGTTLSVDDFGTGYSSLSYLSRLNVHEVKVDRSFVSGLTTRPEDLAIVRATLAMAVALGLDVVAEGIETEGQLDALRDLGVANGQGYLLGRPMTADDALALVSRERREATTVSDR